MDQESVLPKLWFIKLPGLQGLENECKQCDSACFHLFRPSAEGLGLFNTAAFAYGDTLFRQTPSLYREAQDNDHLLLFTRLGMEGPVLLNAPAAAVLDGFALSATLSQVQDSQPGLSADIVAQTAAQLLALGLLEIPGGPSRAFNWEQPDTLATWLHLTEVCNLRCSYCYLNPTSTFMSPEVAREAIDAVFRAARKYGFRRVRLKYAGGEASLNLNALLAAQDHAATWAEETGLRLEAVLLSNGVTLSSRALDELEARGVRIMISLDGIGSYHDRLRPLPDGRGSFVQVHRTIEQLIERGWPPVISVTLTSRNLLGLPELVDFLLARDLYFTLNYYRDNDYAQARLGAEPRLHPEEGEMLAALADVFARIERRLPHRSLLGGLLDRANLSAPHRYTCGVGQNYLVIDPQGRIAKCPMTIGQPVTTIWTKDPLAAVRADSKGIQNLSVEMRGDCVDCEWRFYCAGGCPFLSHRHTGRWDARSPHCSLYQTLFAMVLRVEGLRMLKWETGWQPNHTIK